VSTRSFRAGLAVLGVATIAVLGTANGSAAKATPPTLSIEGVCGVYQDLNSARATLTGFPPFTPFDLTAEWPVGNSASDFTVGGAGLATDANGNWDSASVFGFMGVSEPGIWTATVVWSGGTLSQSVYVDCSQPASKKGQPASKKDCEASGWRDFDFKSQGQCIRFVKHGSRN
jgi:hypothetical protein